MWRSKCRPFSCILEVFECNRRFLPPNTTSLLQPMDQGLIRLSGGDGFDDVTHKEINELVDAHSASN
uniref:DDE-1 domain-containing protein n=1 Tax=Oryzias latipes TaxID=8090 RepID=A0A3P9LIX3_ORYLA